MNESGLKWFLNVTLRDKTDPIFGPVRRKKLKGIDFTIISNNCWGGHAYRWYNLPYNSPTIGLYFWADDYLRFVSNLKHYIEGNLEFIPPQESRHYKSLKKLNQLNVPIGKIDDVEIVFLHYKTQKEAKEKWERRCKRINWNHLLVKNSYMNECTDDIMIEFDRLPYKVKLFFVGKAEPRIKNGVIYKSNELTNDVIEDTIYFNRFFDLTEWINKSF